MRKANVATLRGSAALPEVLHGCVEDQVVGLRERSQRSEHQAPAQYLLIFSLTYSWITSVPPEVKMISSALPPTILATFSLDWLIIALALAPGDKPQWGCSGLVQRRQSKKVNLPAM